MKLYTADAIKEQVHKLLCRDCGETDYCPNCDYRELIDEILDAQTVDAEPVRHGHWIFNPKDAIEMMSTLPKCSECGAESSDGGNYCTHCGAKMDEVEDV